MAKQALFSGLVYDENENPLEVKLIGESAFYVVDDQGFLRHVEAEEVDRQVLEMFLSQLEQNKDVAINEAMRMMGKDDLFTKAALDAQMRQVNADQIIEQGIPQEARNMMGMMGFRVLINIHGDVVRVDQPAIPDDRLE